MNFMKRQQAQHIGASPHRRRRGSVLVLAVAVLAVLAALAVSYVTVVRVDRRSTDAYQRQENLQQQVGVVTAYLQSLLAADLFGNRIVNSATPRTNPFDISQPNWPKAFEDGEYADVPWTYAGQAGVTQPASALTWDLSVPTPGNPTPSPTSNAILDVDLNERAYADDAWLSPVEPIDTTNGPFGDFTEWDTWPQITNLNSAYRWRDSSSFQGWARDRGRFVDLAQFLLQEPPNYTSGARPGYPGASLTLNRSQSGVWTDPFTGRPNGPELGVNQQIFDLQMSDLQEVGYWPSAAPPAPDIGQGEFLPVDERFWADTDGDGRPDSRWQELDLLGNAFGLRWVVAARIIDNSALANVNSHLAYGYPPGADSSISPDELWGDGRTPADVDLFRLIASQSFSAQSIDASTGSLAPTAHPDIRLSNQLNYNQSPQVDSALERSWQLHVNRGVRAPSILEQLQTLNNNGTLALGEENDFLNEWPGGTLYGDSDSNPDPSLIQALDIKRFERAHVWQAFGSNPFNPLASSGLAYPLRDEIDLRAYNGYNLRSFVSRLEQRLDGGFTNNAGFLPGTAPTYTDFVNGPGLGPMRAKEWDLLADSVRTYGNQYALMPAAGQYTNQNKLERLRKDIRHLLTTISGEGSIGPVPVLNTAPEYERSFTTQRMALSRFVNPTGTPNTVDRIRTAVEDSFAGFVWALAPLATNRPLMSPLDTVDSIAYAQLAQDADLHYGGGQTGPATAVAPLYGLSPNIVAAAPGGQDDIGAAYAILRAASLAANLSDAIDLEGAPGSATTEQPTVIRLFNQLNMDYFLGQNPSVLTAINDSNAVPLGVRFPQGDIWGDPINTPIGEVFTGPESASLPEELIGAPNHGVTLVGLDRQPFLVHALSASFYANPEANLNVVGTSQEVDPNLPDHQLGSFFAVEIGNPWEEDLDLAGYTVRIENGTDDFNFDFSAAIDGGGILPAGRRIVFYHFREPINPIGAAQAHWDEARDALLDEFVGNGNDAPAEIREYLDDPIGSAIVADEADMFGAFAGESLPVLLIRDLAGGGASTVQVLVDRLSPPSTDPFPGSLSQVVQFDEFIAGNPGGPTTVNSTAVRVATQASLRRPVANSASGYPAYVVERPSENLHVTQTGSAVGHAWLVGQNGQPALPISEIYDEIIALEEIELLAGEPADKGSLTLPNFELFVPNGPLFATSELGLLNAFTHMYVHMTSGPPDISTAWDLSGDFGLGKWVTVSEQLGWDAHYFYNPNVASTPNPYLGVLDPSRFILNGEQSVVSGVPDLAALTGNNGNAIPDQLAVPLALRVFDAFDALPTPDGVARGRVNVNTAPRRVLELLPLVDPWDQFSFSVPSISGWTPNSGVFDGRHDWIERYRRRDQQVPSNSNNVSDDTIPQRDMPQRYTQIPGLRSPGANAPWSLGFQSRGELSVLGAWTPWGPDPVGTLDAGFPGSHAFLELGANGTSNDAIPLDLRPIITGFEAQDDPEERLALYRAVSNIVSTRSDIFTAWFIIRAYDPKDIEAITIPASMTQADEIAALMNPGNPHGLANVSEDNPGLLPTFERRVLVIFDRSNVRRPNDRPRVLMQVELPGS